MTAPSPASADFLTGFQQIFTRSGFRGTDFQTYLSKPAQQRSGDEASIVDRAIVGPLLDLLGFAPGDQNYNLQRRGDRPDYAPSIEVYGTCFVVESKNTTLNLTLDASNPDSNLGQLWGYMQLLAVDLGMLTNGREIRLYERAGTTVRELLALDVAAALAVWAAGPTMPLPIELAAQITQIERMCSLASFSDPDRMERELGIDLQPWLARALPLGTTERNEALLVLEVQQLIAALHADARQALQRHRDAAIAYERRQRYLDEREEEEAGPKLGALRERVLAELESVKSSLGLNDEHKEAIRGILREVVAEASPYPSKKALVDAVLEVVNAARALKYADRPRFARPWADLDAALNLKGALDSYGDVVAVHLKRQTELRLHYRETRAVAARGFAGQQRRFCGLQAGRRALPGCARAARRGRPERDAEQQHLRPGQPPDQRGAAARQALAQCAGCGSARLSSGLPQPPALARQSLGRCGGSGADARACAGSGRIRGGHPGPARSDQRPAGSDRSTRPRA
jgi:type I restriction enzyme M protein